MSTSQQEGKDSKREKLAQFELLGEYLDFLHHHRRLAKNTVNMRQHDVMVFLKSLKLKNDRKDIRKISVHQIYVAS